MKKICLLVVATMVLAGCTKEVNETPSKGEYSISATVATQAQATSAVSSGGFEVLPWNEEGTSTRTQLGDETGTGVSLIWSAGDVINVYPTSLDGTTLPYTIATGVGTSSATFTGTALTQGTSYLATHAVSSASFNAGVMSLSIPSVQTQAADKSSLHLKDCDVLYSAPAVAGASGAAFSFKHAGALLQFEITGVAGIFMTSITVKDATAGKSSFNRNFTLTGAGVLAPKAFTNGMRLDGNKAGSVFTTDVFIGYMVVSADANKEGNALEIIVHTSVGDYSFNRAVPAGGFVAGKRYKTPYTINVTPFTGALPTISGKTVTVASANDLLWVAGVSNGIITGAAAQGAPANFEGWTINQSANIDLTGEVWTPIQNGIDFINLYPTNGFAGTFDGANYTISGLTSHLNGLFKVVSSSGVVKNVTLSSGAVDGSAIKGDRYIASIAGHNYGVIEGCVNDGCNISVSGYGSYSTGAGGIVYLNRGTVRGCVNKATVTSSVVYSYAGGVAALNSGTILACLNTGTVSGNGPYAGGFNGSNESTIVGCISGGTVNNEVPADLYTLAASNYYTITNCWYPALTTPVGTDYGSVTSLSPFTAPDQITVTAMNTILSGAYSSLSAGWRWNAPTAGNYPTLTKE